MKQHGGDALRLVPGKPVRLARGGVLQPVTKELLTEAQVMAFLREIATATVTDRLGPAARLSFAYESPIGPIEVTVAPEVGGAGATLRPAAVGGPNGRVAPDLTQHKVEIERLLRRMVESGGSDLHLRADATRGRSGLITSQAPRHLEI